MSRTESLRRSVAVFAVIGLLLGAGACDRRNGKADGATTVPTEVPTTETVPTTEPPAVSYEVPDVIDAAYVETVMRALDHIYGEAVRHLARTRTVSDVFLNHLVAIYNDREFELQQEIWARSWAEGFQGVASNPGNPITTVQRLVRADSHCIIAAVSRNLDPTLSSPDGPSPQHYVALIRSTPQRDTLRLNPTPWVMSFDGWVQSGNPPETPCA